MSRFVPAPMTAADPLDAALSLPPGRVRTIFAADVVEVLAALNRRAADEGRPARVVSDHLDHLPAPTGLLDAAVHHLARVALTVWPDWCEGKDHGESSAGWTRAAAALCRRGRVPLPRGFGLATHAAEIARALDPGDLVFALAVTEAEPASGRVLGLARASEWLAREANARVLVIVPDRWRDSRELDGINFNALVWGPGLPSSPGAVTPTPPRPHRVVPILGRPHPDSQGEQILARALASDAELAPLFQFNTRVATRSGRRYLADLIWPEGRVVVEVDGYYFHSDLAAFARDRHRDYELLTSNYLTLRLPHDEVLADVALAVEKIRDVVHFRRLHPLPG